MKIGDLVVQTKLSLPVPIEALGVILKIEEMYLVEFFHGGKFWVRAHQIKLLSEAK
jgi:hypothetical protein